MCIIIKRRILSIFLFISAYFCFLILESLVVTNRGDESAVCVIVINKIILYFLCSRSSKI